MPFFDKRSKNPICKFPSPPFIPINPSVLNGLNLKTSFINRFIISFDKPVIYR